MINYVVCDLFLSPASVLVNTVNTVGVMGKGIAKDFKHIYPEMFHEYQDLCERGLLEVGKLHLFKTPNKWILNFPTKKHWRHPSRVEYIRAGLKKFVATHHQYGITSVSFPQLGCGNGELDWVTQVRPIMEELLGTLPITVFIHLSDVTDPFTPEHSNMAEVKKWLRQEPESLAFTEVWDDLVVMLASPSHLHTCDHNEPFTALLDSTNRGLILRTQHHEHVIPYDALTELWQFVRQSGFVAGTRLPGGYHVVHSYLLTLLAQLPYLAPVVMTERHDVDLDHAFGLRFQPRSITTQLPLLATAGVVEPV